ncbi:hypothetical protein [Clostridium saccharoperbutylacetonicum]|uniref:hypothetical protein n=1 Tax=Clostridium saccharoperbutylacetonicum TaxID=36745 RepID=UPI0039E97424
MEDKLLLKKVHILEPKGKNVLTVSFRHPLINRQITKSLGTEIARNFEEATKIANEIEKVINNPEYYESYSGFVKANSEFASKTIDVVFGNTDFMNKYNSNLSESILEDFIPIRSKDGKFKTKTVQLIGLPGAGKTVFCKQIIGSIESSFPATTESNTTIGSFESFISKNSKELKNISTCFSKKIIKDYLIQNLWNSIEFCLGSKDSNSMHNKFDIENDNLIYRKMMESKDRKTKFNFILGDTIEDIPEFTEVNKRIEILADRSWEVFCKNENIENKSYTEISEIEKNNYNNFITEENKEFSKEFEKVIEKYFDIMIDKVKHKIINALIEKLNEIKKDNCEIIVDFYIVDASGKKYEYINDSIKYIDELKWINYIYIELKYVNESPDKRLIDKFFKVMEFISSGSEGFRGRTLFPLISGIRLSGNFKPLWFNKNLDDFILLDSEGIGHDIANRNISEKMRFNLLHADQIFWILNAKGSKGTDDKDILKYLIVSGYLIKTKLCFNRLELLDTESNNADINKVSYINNQLEHLLDVLAQEDTDSNKLISSNKQNYTNILNSRCVLLEHLDKVIEGNQAVIFDKKKYEMQRKILYSALKDIKTDKEIDSLAIETTIEKIELSKVVEKLTSLIEGIKKMVKPIYPNGFVPEYKYDRFIHLSNQISIEFKVNFLNELYKSDWQTVKAFNRRIAYDFDGRSWWNLHPEFTLESIIKTHLMSFLTNPNNAEKCGNELAFIQYMNYLMSTMSGTLIEIVKNVIFLNNQDEWEYCIKKVYGSGSTPIRVSRIENNIIRKYFDINYNDNKVDKLLEELKRVVNQNYELKNVLKIKFIY